VREGQGVTPGFLEAPSMMQNPVKLARIWREAICRNGKFALDKNPSKSLGYPAQGLTRSYFRQWQPIKDKRSLAFDENGTRITDFDPYKDSWFDYPVIVRSKLGGSWELYNLLTTIHVPACTFSCWHCYVDDQAKNPRQMLERDSIEYVSASDIVDAFLSQREMDEAKGRKTNVLRVSGGEPFLSPDLILQILKYLRMKDLSDEIFVWTETNLSPFLKDDGSSKSLVEEWVDLRELATYDNLAVHPCLHGISPSNYHHITQCDPYYFDGLLSGLDMLVKLRFDVYPTIGSNVSPPSMIPYIFRRIRDIHKDLPQRFAFIDYELLYPPTRERILKTLKPTRLYNKIAVIHTWDRLLKESYGEGYPVKPRHMVSL
jgi:uncharacterized Fe-S cluster-containing radical SAM superfamily protein